MAVQNWAKNIILLVGNEFLFSRISSSTYKLDLNIESADSAWKERALHSAW